MSIVRQADGNTDKKWDVITVSFVSDKETTWGISHDQIPALIQLMKQKKIGQFRDDEHSISFINIKKLVAYLYEEDFDTADLPAATTAFISREQKEEAGQKRQRDFNSSVQAMLHRFQPSIPQPITNQNSNWDPAWQQAWAAMQEFFNLRKALPIDQVLMMIDRIAVRRPKFICNDEKAFRFIPNISFAEKIIEGSEFELSPSGTAGILKKGNKEIIQFPDITDPNPAPFDAFAACLMVLQLNATKPPEDFCDLWLMKDLEEWQTLDEFSHRNRNKFYSDPQYVLSFSGRTQVSFTIRYIPKTNYSIEIIGFYLSGSFAMAATMGYDTDDHEIGKERLFDAEMFFREYNTDPGKNELTVLPKADYIKFFIVRKKREKYVEEVSYQPPGYTLPLEFYQLITTDPEAILATVCFGLQFPEPADTNIEKSLMP